MEEPVLPEGKLVRKAAGGTDSLKTVLADLKRYSFTGYVRTLLGKGEDRSVGYVVVVEGTPEVALHHVGGQTKAGKVGLRSVWQDSYTDACHIEVHAKVDLDSVLAAFPNAGLERKDGKAAKEPSKAAPSGPKRASKALAPGVVDKLRAWRDAGYAVDALTAILEGGNEEAAEVLADFEAAVARMEPLREELDALHEPNLAGEIEALRERARDPALHEEVAGKLVRLKEDIEKVHRPALSTLGEDREVRLQERARQVFEMIVRHRQAEGKPADISETQVAKALEGKGPIRDERTDLIRQYTFETFVVGPSNRFAHAAAMAVAKSPHNAYNPLFITSGSGLGKTHLLNAIGDAILRENEDAKVVYVTAEGFSNEFREAMSTNHLNEFREKYRGLDVALVDDAHFLSGKGDVQEELFHTFDALYNANKQIVLTSDRPPKEIPDLEDRLVSRFESGLIADIQPPEYDTRLAILRRRVRESGANFDEEVLTHIARRVEHNIRELGGALTRVIAFSSLMDQPVSLDLAKEVLKDLGEPIVGPGRHDVSREISHGHSYLVEEDRPERAFELLNASAGGGRSLLITRSNPRRIKEKHDVRADRILWLTERETGTVETIPPSLERIVYVIEEFMKQAEHGAIMLDGVEYLVSSNSFDSVLKFLRRLVDHTSESQFTLLVSVSTKTMKEQEIKNLEREMEVVSF